MVELSIVVTDNGFIEVDSSTMKTIRDSTLC
jgi:hypothetical protein